MRYTHTNVLYPVISYKWRRKYLWNLRFTQWCVRGFGSFGMWGFVTGLVVPDILKAVWSFDVSGTTKPVTEHHISEDICSRYSIVISHSVHNTVYWLQELREEFDKFGWLLTAPLGMLPDTIEHSYNVPAISKYLDYLFAFCYAYHGHWNKETGPNAPLYPLYADDEFNVVRIHQVCCRLVLSKPHFLVCPCYVFTV